MFMFMLMFIALAGVILTDTPFFLAYRTANDISRSTGCSGEFMCADAIVFAFALNDKDGWRQIA